MNTPAELNHHVRCWIESPCKRGGNYLFWSSNRGERFEVSYFTTRKELWRMFSMIENRELKTRTHDSKFLSWRLEKSKFFLLTYNTMFFLYFHPHLMTLNNRYIEKNKCLNSNSRLSRRWEIDWRMEGKTRNMITYPWKSWFDLISFDPHKILVIFVSTKVNISCSKVCNLWK